MKSGTENVTRSLASLADVESTVDIKSLSFVEPADIAAEIGTDRIYSASFLIQVRSRTCWITS
ncbi:MAG: hypothetical protein V5A34_07830 [Halapricum sp.]